MSFRFVHVADIHLGYEQYNLARRFDDFAQAYIDMVEFAISERVDFVLIAGDLFHRANADATTLNQATYGLTALRRANIPVLAIEGNHDAQHYRKHISWMEYLCDQELLTLLNLQPDATGLKTLVPFDPAPGARRGSFIDVAGARIYGIKYYGAATARVLEDVRDQIEAGSNDYTILAMHAGLEGQVPHVHGGLTHGQIEPLRTRVNYLALGHIHKRLLAEKDWIFNPGSTETNSFEEAEWPHGFFDVRVDPTSAPMHEVTPIASPHLRPFCRIAVHAEGVHSVDEFVERVSQRISGTRGIPDAAVVELQLGGVAEFRRQDLPLEKLRGSVEVAFEPLTVRIRNNLVPPEAVWVRRDEGMSRSDLERQVIEHLVRQAGDRRDRAEDWARLIVDIKNMASEDDVPASIVDHARAALQRIGGYEHGAAKTGVKLDAERAVSD